MCTEREKENFILSPYTMENSEEKNLKKSYLGPLFV